MARVQCVEPGCTRFRIAGGERCRRHSAAFYVAALPRELRLLFEQATAQASLEEEIRLLRSLVHRAAEEHPNDADFRQKCALLIRAVLAQRQLAKATREDVESSVLEVLRGLRDGLEEEG
jgi:pheromone shutdown protein TraB